jgi:hypothetical protein
MSISSAAISGLAVGIGDIVGDAVGDAIGDAAGFGGAGIVCPSCCAKTV